MTEPQIPSTPPSESRTHKRRWPKWLLIVGAPLMAAGLFFVPRAMAGPFGHGFGGHHGHHQKAESPEQMREHMQAKVGRMLDRLDATDAQRANIDVVLEATSVEMFELAEQGRRLRGELKQALLAEEIDLARIQGLTDETEATVAQATRAGIETMAEISAELDAEQRQKVARFVERFMPEQD